MLAFRMLPTYSSVDINGAKEIHSRQNYYLHIAAQVAMNSVMNHKHGAVIVHKKNIIASGCNYQYMKTDIKHSIHAEIAAILDVRGKDKEILHECEMYVVRIAPPKFDNALKYSKPCHNCQSYICKKSIRRIFYSTQADEILDS